MGLLGYMLTWVPSAAEWIYSHPGLTLFHVVSRTFEQLGGFCHMVIYYCPWCIARGNSVRDATLNPPDMDRAIGKFSFHVLFLDESYRTFATDSEGIETSEPDHDGGVNLNA